MPPNATAFDLLDGAAQRGDHDAQHHETGRERDDEGDERERAARGCGAERAGRRCAKMTRNCATDTASSGSALPTMISARGGVAGAQAVPGVPAVFGEEREARHSDDVEAVDDGFAGHDLLGAVGSGIAVRGERERERRLEERHQDEREHDEHHDRQRVAREQAELVADDRGHPSTRHRLAPRSPSTGRPR